MCSEAFSVTKRSQSFLYQNWNVPWLLKEGRKQGKRQEKKELRKGRYEGRKDGWIFF